MSKRMSSKRSIPFVSPLSTYIGEPSGEIYKKHNTTLLLKLRESLLNLKIIQSFKWLKTRCILLLSIKLVFTKTVTPPECLPLFATLSRTELKQVKPLKKLSNSFILFDHVSFKPHISKVLEM